MSDYGRGHHPVRRALSEHEVSYDEAFPDVDVTE